MFLVSVEGNEDILLKLCQYAFKTHLFDLHEL